MQRPGFLRDSLSQNAGTDCCVVVWSQKCDMYIWTRLYGIKNLEKKLCLYSFITFLNYKRTGNFHYAIAIINVFLQTDLSWFKTSHGCYIFVLWMFTLKNLVKFNFGTVYGIKWWSFKAIVTRGAIFAALIIMYYNP